MNGKHMSLAAVPVVLAALLASTAQAQEHRRSEFTLAYNMISPSSDADSPQISIRSDWMISGALGLQGNFGYIDGGNGLANTAIGLHGYYELPSGVRAGLFYQHERFFISGGGFSPTFATLGVEAIIPLSPEALVELYVGTTDIEGYPAPLTGATSYGIEASYAFSPSLRGRIHFDVDELKSVLPVDTLSEMGTGLDYFVNSDGSGVPLILSADWVRAKNPFSSDSQEAFTLKVTIPIGGNPGSTGRKLFGDRTVSESFVKYSD
jgi:hypothetical protein